MKIFKISSIQKTASAVIRVSLMSPLETLRELQEDLRLEFSKALVGTKLENQPIEMSIDYKPRTHILFNILIPTELSNYNLWIIQFVQRFLRKNDVGILDITMDNVEDENRSKYSLAINVNTYLEKAQYRVVFPDHELLDAVLSIIKVPRIKTSNNQYDLSIDLLLECIASFRESVRMGSWSPDLIEYFSSHSEIYDVDEAIKILNKLENLKSHKGNWAVIEYK